ncbi:MAG: radical SAM protein [Thermoplasmata archaeon]
MRTRIYHITKFQDNSSYIFFNGCNWDCDFCIMKRFKYDIHLEKEVQADNFKYIDVETLMDILLENNIIEVFLGGGEPTIDPSLPLILERLKMKDIRVNLLTNGELLNSRIVSLVDRISFSIKSLDENTHFMITKRSNLRSIENLKKFFNEKFTFETVYTRELGCRNVIEIAEFLESFGKNLILRIDPLIPVGNLFTPPPEYDLNECINHINSRYSVKAYRIKGKGKNAVVLYP